jgi:hypothetical protein
MGHHVKATGFPERPQVATKKEIDRTIFTMKKNIDTFCQRHFHKTEAGYWFPVCQDRKGNTFQCYKCPNKAGYHIPWGAVSCDLSCVARRAEREASGEAWVAKRRPKTFTLAVNTLSSPCGYKLQE